MSAAVKCACFLWLRSMTLLTSADSDAFTGEKLLCMDAAKCASLGKWSEKLTRFT